MKTEDVMRFEAELRAMREALGTLILVGEFANQVLLAERRTAPGRGDDYTPRPQEKTTLNPPAKV